MKIIEVFNDDLDKYDPVFSHLMNDIIIPLIPGWLEKALIKIVNNKLAGHRIGGLNYTPSVDELAELHSTVIENVHNYFGGDIRYPDGAGYEDLLTHMPSCVDYILVFEDPDINQKHVEQQIMAKHPNYKNNSPTINRLIFFLNDGDVDSWFFEKMVMYVRSIIWSSVKI